MQLSWPSPPGAFSPCRTTTIVSLPVWRFVDDEAPCVSEFLQPLAPKQSASEIAPHNALENNLNTIEVCNIPYFLADRDEPHSIANMTDIKGSENRLDAGKCRL
jgi:hypothetical protein